MLPFSTGQGLSQRLQGGNHSSEIGIIEVESLAMKVESGRQVSVGAISPHEYSYEELWHTVDQSADPPHSFPDIKAAHISSLVEWLHSLHFNNVRGMIIVTFSSVMNPEGEMSGELFEHSAECQVVKPDLKIVIAELHYIFQAFLTL